MNGDREWEWEWRKTAWHTERSKRMCSHNTQKRIPPANCNGRQDVILWHIHNISHQHKKCQQKIAHTNTHRIQFSAFSIPLVYICHRIESHRMFSHFHNERSYVINHNTSWYVSKAQHRSSNGENKRCAQIVTRFNGIQDAIKCVIKRLNASEYLNGMAAWLCNSTARKERIDNMEWRTERRFVESKGFHLLNCWPTECVRCTYVHDMLWISFYGFMFIKFAAAQTRTSSVGRSSVHCMHPNTMG